MPNNIKVFYSWQSDLSDTTNKRVIRNMLIQAKSKIEMENSDDMNIIIDEATRDMVGSQNIPETIIKKITNSDIFVADVSIVNNVSDARKMPNPNVMFELGFAVAKLGWERIILIFNNHYSDLEHVPFDIDRHRIMQYTISDEMKADVKALIASHSNHLYEQITLILSENPSKQCVEIAKMPEEIKRERDIKNIELFLSCIQLDLIDEFIEETPRIINDDIFFFYEYLASIASSSRFHMYNQELYALFIDFYNAWNTILAYPECYHDNRDATRHIWYNPGDMPLSDDKQKIWDEINKARSAMRGSLNSILHILREEYINIDIALISNSNYAKLQAYKAKQIF
jgi:nucleoside 2-deoxyribosyltransferase